jgi:hypothetical protein
MSEPIERWRGLAARELPASIELHFALAPIERVGRVYARMIRARSWERDVHGRECAGPGEVLYQFKGHPWTGSTSLGPAAIFSRDLGGRVFVYGQHHVTGAIVYGLYDCGTMVESYCWAPDIDDGTGRQFYFRSQLRESGPPDDLDPLDFIDEVCRQLGLYVEYPPIGASRMRDEAGGPYTILDDGRYRREEYERVDWITRDPRHWLERKRDW